MINCLRDDVYAFNIEILDINTEIFRVREYLRPTNRPGLKKNENTHRVLQIQSDKSTNEIYEQDIIYRNDAK